MLNVDHIHYPSLYDCTMNNHGGVKDVNFKRVGRKYTIYRRDKLIKTLDIKLDHDERHQGGFGKQIK